MAAYIGSCKTVSNALKGAKITPYVHPVSKSWFNCPQKMGRNKEVPLTTIRLAATEQQVDSFLLHFTFDQFTCMCPHTTDEEEVGQNEEALVDPKAKSLGRL